MGRFTGRERDRLRKLRKQGVSQEERREIVFREREKRTGSRSKKRLSKGDRRQRQADILNRGDKHTLDTVGRGSKVSFKDLTDDGIRNVVRDVLEREADAGEIAQLRNNPGNLKSWLHGLNNKGGELRARKTRREQQVKQSVENLKAQGLTDKQARAHLRSQFGMGLKKYARGGNQALKNWEENIRHKGALAEEGGVLGLAGVSKSDIRQIAEVTTFFSPGVGLTHASILGGKAGAEGSLKQTRSRGFKDKDVVAVNSAAVTTAATIAGTILAPGAGTYGGMVAGATLGAFMGSATNQLAARGRGTPGLTTEDQFKSIAVNTATAAAGAAAAGALNSVNNTYANLAGQFATGTALSAARGNSFDDALVDGAIQATTAGIGMGLKGAGINVDPGTPAGTAYSGFMGAGGVLARGGSTEEAMMAGAQAAASSYALSKINDRQELARQRAALSAGTIGAAGVADPISAGFLAGASLEGGFTPTAPTTPAEQGFLEGLGVFGTEFVGNLAAGASHLSDMAQRGFGSVADLFPSEAERQQQQRVSDATSLLEEQFEGAGQAFDGESPEGRALIEQTAANIALAESQLPATSITAAQQAALASGAPGAAGALAGAVPTALAVQPDISPVPEGVVPAAESMTTSGGESLNSIAEDFGVSAELVLAANPQLEGLRNNPDAAIAPGEQVQLPTTPEIAFDAEASDAALADTIGALNEERALLGLPPSEVTPPATGGRLPFQTAEEAAAVAGEISRPAITPASEILAQVEEPPLSGDPEVLDVLLRESPEAADAQFGQARVDEAFDRSGLARSEIPLGFETEDALDAVSTEVVEGDTLEDIAAHINDIAGYSVTSADNLRKLNDMPADQDVSGGETILVPQFVETPTTVSDLDAAIEEATAPVTPPLRTPPEAESRTPVPATSVRDAVEAEIKVTGLPEDATPEQVQAATSNAVSRVAMSKATVPTGEATIEDTLALRDPVAAADLSGDPAYLKTPLVYAEETAARELAEGTINEAQVDSRILALVAEHERTFGEEALDAYYVNQRLSKREAEYQSFKAGLSTSSREADRSLIEDARVQARLDLEAARQELVPVTAGFPFGGAVAASKIAESSVEARADEILRTIHQRRLADSGHPYPDPNDDAARYAATQEERRAVSKEMRDIVGVLSGTSEAAKEADLEEYMALVDGYKTSTDAGTEYIKYFREQLTATHPANKQAIARIKARGGPGAQFIEEMERGFDPIVTDEKGRRTDIFGELPREFVDDRLVLEKAIPGSPTLAAIDEFGKTGRVPTPDAGRLEVARNIAVANHARASLEKKLGKSKYDAVLSDLKRAANESVLEPVQQVARKMPTSMAGKFFINGTGVPYDTWEDANKAAKGENDEIYYLTTRVEAIDGEVSVVPFFEKKTSGNLSQETKDSIFASPALWAPIITGLFGIAGILIADKGSKKADKVSDREMKQQLEVLEAMENSNYEEVQAKEEIERNTGHAIPSIYA